MKFKDVSDYVGQAIENGFSHIDTAQCMLLLSSNRNDEKNLMSQNLFSYKVYQTETYVGLAIKESGLPRSSLYITTKYSGPGKSQQAIHQSLNKVSNHILLTSTNRKTQ